MISDQVGKALHDRVTRGESLSAKEKARLEQWYAAQDNAERKQLGLPAIQEKLPALQAQVDAALTQLMTVTQRIQEIATENETLRREIAALRRQLAHLLGPQPA